MRPKPKLNISKSLKKAAPTILTCVSMAGVVVTAVLTAKATPKALDQIKAAEDIKMAENGEKMTRLETIETCWMTYTPAAIAGIATIGCIFGANLMNRRQQASLIATCAFLDRSFKEYQQSVRDVFGEEGHEQVVQQLMVNQANPPAIYDQGTGESFDFGITNDEKHLFYDMFSQRYFSATFADVLLAEIHVNRSFAINGGEISLCAFYEFLGLDTPDELKDLYWFVSDYYYFIDFTHTKHYVDDGLDNEPIECWTIEMPFLPTLEPMEYESA